MSTLSNEKQEQLYEVLDQFIDGLPHKEGMLIDVLHKAQEIFGYLPRELQQHIAKRLDIPVSKVFGVVSFYSFFTMEPKGEHPISICMGTACYVRGAEKVLNEFKKQLDIEVGETTKDGKFSLNALRCVGACGLAPVVMVGEKVFGRVTPDMVKEILGQYENV